MITLFKQLFCKHDWEIINAETPIENKIIDTDKGKNLQYTCRVGVNVLCTKCGKIDKHTTKVLTQVKIKEIKQRLFCEGIQIIKEWGWLDEKKADDIK